MKQQQNRPATRAPHGEPRFTERFAFYCTDKQKRKLMRKGGADWLRKLIESAA